MIGTATAGFRIVTELGSGPIGEVYFAEREDGTRAAFKILRLEACGDDSALAEVFRAVTQVGQLECPHVARVYETGLLEDQAFVASEMVEGESLEERFERMPALEPREAAEIAASVADALAAAHEAGHTHCGIKPTNVFVHRGMVKVTDFALSRLMVEADPTFETATYASPEQCRGERIDARSDVYSLGALLYHALVGRPPFEAPDAALLVVAHANEAPAPPRTVRHDIPRWLDKIVLRAMAKDPLERYQTARAMADVLREGLASAFGEELRGTAKEDTPAPEAARTEEAELPAAETVATEEAVLPPGEIERTEQVPLPDLDGPPTQKTTTPVPPAHRSHGPVDSQPPSEEERQRRVADKLSRALVQRIVSGRLELPAVPPAIAEISRQAEGTDVEADAELDTDDADADETLRALLGDAHEPTVAAARLAGDVAASTSACDPRLAYLAVVVLGAGAPVVRAALPPLEAKLKEPDSSHVGPDVASSVVLACHREVAVSLAYAWQLPEAIPQALPKVGFVDDRAPTSLSNVVTLALALAITSGTIEDHPCIGDAEPTATRAREALALSGAACDAIVALQVV